MKIQSNPRLTLCFFEVDAKSECMAIMSWMIKYYGVFRVEAIFLYAQENTYIVAPCKYFNYHFSLLYF